MSVRVVGHGGPGQVDDVERDETGLHKWKENEILSKNMNKRKTEILLELWPDDNSVTLPWDKT